MRNGIPLVGRVLEISLTEVKYKKAENMEGPTYTELKQEIGSIKYKNGIKETFKSEKPWMSPENKSEFQPVAIKKNPELKKVGKKYWYGDKTLGEAEMHDVLLFLNDPKITSHIKSAKRQKGWQYIGFGAIPCAVASLVYFGEASGNRYNKQLEKSYTDNGRIWAALSAACITTSITLKVKRTQHNAAAVKLYRQNY